MVRSSLAGLHFCGLFRGAPIQWENPMNATRCLFLFAVLISGCGQSTLDTSNEAALKASIERMSAGMTKEQKEAFGKDCMAAVLPDAMKDAFSSAMKSAGNKTEVKKPSETDLLKPLHGLTVAQIHQKAEEARAEMKKRFAK